MAGNLTQNQVAEMREFMRRHRLIERGCLPGAFTDEQFPHLTTAQLKERVIDALVAAGQVVRVERGRGQP